MLSAQQTRSGIPTEQQSVLPTVRGVPWWGAVLIAGGPTVVGAVIDGSNADGLSTTYRILYFVGCVAAVLAVRRRSLFTAITQPPLIAFGVALVTLYVLKGDSGSGLRTLVINVMLPIAKTFPVMAWTFVLVALLGAGRWFLTRHRSEVTPKRSARHHAAGRSGRSRSTSRTARGRDRDKPAATRSTTGEAGRTATADAPAARPTRRPDAGRAETARPSARDRPARSDATVRRSTDDSTRATPNRATPTRGRPDPARDRDPDARPGRPRSGDDRGRPTGRPRLDDLPARRRDTGRPDDAADRTTGRGRPRDDAPRDATPPPGHRGAMPSRTGREVPPRADGFGRRRPAPSPRDDAVTDVSHPDDLPPIPRARYRGVNP